MTHCQYVMRTGKVCSKKSSGVRCTNHKGKRNKLRKRKRNGRKLVHTANNIRFYDVSTGKIISVSRDSCKLRRSSGRGGDQVYANVGGRRLFTFVPRGFEL